MNKLNILKFVFFITGFLYPSTEEYNERNSYHNNLNNLKESVYRIKMNKSPYDYEFNFFSPLILKGYYIISNIFPKYFNMIEFLFLKRISIILLFLLINLLVKILKISKEKELLFTSIILFNPFSYNNLSESGFIFIELFFVFYIVYHIKFNNNIFKYLLIALATFHLTKYMLLILVLEKYYNQNILKTVFKTIPFIIIIHLLYNYLYNNYLFKSYFMYYSGYLFVNYEGYQTEILFNSFENFKKVSIILFIIFPLYFVVPLETYFNKLKNEKNIESIIISVCLILINLTQPYENNFESTLAIILLFLSENLIKNILVLLLLLVAGFFKIKKMYNFEYYSNYFFIESANINSMNFMIGISISLLYTVIFVKLDRKNNN